MKNPAIILLSFLMVLVFVSCGQSEQKDETYFLLQKDSNTISLNTFEDNKIEEKKAYPISGKSIYATDQKQRVAILDTASNKLSLYEIQSSKETKLSIPFDIKAMSIFLNNDNIFIGGQMVEEMLVQYHIGSGEWYRPEIPEEISFPYKAIDDMVANDSLLIAIDNQVIPKYILLYRLNPTGKLLLSSMEELKPNGAYENIYQGRITPKYFGLRSDTHSRLGRVSHITIYDQLNLKKSFAISTRWGKIEDNHTFNDFAIIGDKVVIASKENGLGVYTVSPSDLKEPQYESDYHNAAVSASNISYTQYKDEEIKKLTLIPNYAKVILTIANKEGVLRHEIKDI